jgi:hypothetical protein
MINHGGYMEIVSGTNVLFQQGLAYWQNEDSQSAAHSRPSAANQADTKSRKALKKESSLERLEEDDEQRLNGFAVDILETFGGPAFSQTTIDELELALRNCIRKWRPSFGEI